MVQAFPEEQKRRQHIIDKQDGGFYRKRAKYLFGAKSAHDSATELEEYCKKHLFHNCKGHSKRDTRSIQQYEI